jgi:hypothetical protein
MIVGKRVDTLGGTSGGKSGEGGYPGDGHEELVAVGMRMLASISLMLR